MNSATIPHAEIVAFLWACAGAIGIAIVILVVAAVLEWRRVSRFLEEERQDRNLEPPKPEPQKRKAPNWIH